MVWDTVSNKKSINNKEIFKRLSWNNIDNISSTSKEIIEEYTPKLFSEDQDFQESTTRESKESAQQESEELFDQDINEEEDFEIPAFLRKQKF